MKIASVWLAAAACLAVLSPALAFYQGPAYDFIVQLNPSGNAFWITPTSFDGILALRFNDTLENPLLNLDSDKTYTFNTSLLSDTPFYITKTNHQNNNGTVNVEDDQPDGIDGDHFGGLLTFNTNSLNNDDNNNGNNTDGNSTSPLWSYFYGSNVGSISVGQVNVYNFDNLYAQLNGTNEVPTRLSSGSGNAHFYYHPDTLTLVWALRFDALVGTQVTAWHIHKGTANISSSLLAVGSVTTAVYDGIGAITPNPLSDTVSWDRDSLVNGWIWGWNTLNSPLYTNDLLNAQFYINVHTNYAPGGEIRGQILKDNTILTDYGQTLPPVNNLNFFVILNGTNEADANGFYSPQASNATGYGWLSINPQDNTLWWNIRFNQLIGGDITAWHFHRGTSTTQSPFLAIGSTTNDNTIYTGYPNLESFPVDFGRTFDTDSTTSGWYNDTVTLNAPQYPYDFNQSMFYFNIHTTNYPSGEIRGQVLPVGTTLSDFGLSLPTLNPNGNNGTNNNTQPSSSSSSSTGSVGPTTDTLSVTNNGDTAYRFTVLGGSISVAAGDNPDIIMNPGSTVIFDLSNLDSNHPFYILKQSTLPTTGNGNTFGEISEARLNGTNHFGSGSFLTFTPTSPGQFVYVDAVHLYGGNILVSGTSLSSSTGGISDGNFASQTGVDMTVSLFLTFLAIFYSVFA